MESNKNDLSLTYCPICIESLATLDPQLIKLQPCSHLLWYILPLIHLAKTALCSTTRKTRRTSALVVSKSSSLMSS